jgi:hypothetical protein
MTTRDHTDEWDTEGAYDGALIHTLTVAPRGIRQVRDVIRRPDAAHQPVVPR